MYDYDKDPKVMWKEISLFLSNLSVVAIVVIVSLCFVEWDIMWRDVRVLALLGIVAGTCRYISKELGKEIRW